MATTKPDYTYKWASDGDKIAPSNSKIQTGWSPEIPPYQWENWIQNRQDEMLAHINERGIAEWDNKTDYIAGKSYVQGSDGKVYKSVTASGPTTTVQDPVTDSTDTYWTIAFADVGAFLTQAAGDTRYTQRSNNLSDLTNVAAARTNLALGTAATATLTTSGTDGTDGRVTKVGDFGLGGLNAQISSTDLNALNKTGFYRGDNLTNSPAGTVWYYVIHQEHGSSGYSSQIAIELAGSAEKIYARKKIGGSWMPWREIALSNSPTFTGTPTAPTAAAGTSNTQLATTAFVTSAATLNAPISTVAAASTINLTTGAPGTSQIEISGSGVSIANFTVAANRAFLLKFSGSNTLVNSASLVTGSGSDIVTVAGDSCWVRATAANTVEILTYTSYNKSNIHIGSLTTASGSAVLLSGIPSWANRINLFFYRLSTDGTSPVIVRLGTSGGVEATGYEGSYAGSGSASGTLSTGFQPGGNNAASDSRHMNMVISRISGNIWSAFCVHAVSGSAIVYQMSGSKSLSGALDRIQITTVNGTPTFDTGSISISWE